MSSTPTERRISSSEIPSARRPSGPRWRWEVCAGEEQIGVARYVTNLDKRSCEFALTVSDQWQSKGIGHVLMRDLMDVAIKMIREDAMAKVRYRAEDAAEERILDALVSDASDDTRQKFRKMLREGKLDDKEIELEIETPSVGVEIMAPPGMEEMTNQLQGMFQNLGANRSKTKKLKVAEAILANLNRYRGLLNGDDIPRTTEIILSFDDPFEEFAQKLKQLSKEWEASGLREQRR